MDAIGPLSEAELLVLLRLTVWVTSIQGAAAWEDISLQAAMARRIVRENPDGWPEKRGDKPKQPPLHGDETPSSPESHGKLDQADLELASDQRSTIMLLAESHPTPIPLCVSRTVREKAPCGVAA
jgi:hypothetical protein